MPGTLVAIVAYDKLLSMLQSNNRLGQRCAEAEASSAAEIYTHIYRSARAPACRPRFLRMLTSSALSKLLAERQQVYIHREVIAATKDQIAA